VLASLFVPWNDCWEEHLSLVDCRIVGPTPKGRATAALLPMNDERRIKLRRQLQLAANRH
jgi:hypothetical protein